MTATNNDFRFKMQVQLENGQMSNKTSIRSKLLSVAFSAGALTAAGALVTVLGQGEDIIYWALALEAAALLVLFTGLLGKFQNFKSQKYSFK